MAVTTTEQTDERSEALPVPEPIHETLAAPPVPGIRLPIAVLAAFLSGGAAAWITAGLFRSPIASGLICLLGLVIGVASAWSAHLLRRPLIHYAGLAGAVVVAAAIVSPVATGGTANLPGLVAEAFRGGGLLQPPISFEPGWRFILLLLFALLGLSSVGMTIATDRVKYAVAVPLPVTIGAAVLHAQEGALVAGSVGAALVIASLAIAYGAELAPGSAVSSRFQWRRLARGALMLAGLLGATVLLAQTGLLFPETQRERVLPPRKPPSAPLEPDRELFEVDAPRPGPWRMGQMDVYDGAGWLLPPYEPDRLVDLGGGLVGPPGESGSLGTEVFRFTVRDIRGRQLPGPAGMVRVDGLTPDAGYDPRTQTLQLPFRVPQGLSYEVSAARIPTGEELSSAPEPAVGVQERFGKAPPPPNAVLSLLATAPANPFDRLQFLRDQLYANVLAAGGGSPIDVAPSRVAQMLQPGTEATPFEITAAEALLARWADVPSRIGYGYYRGDAVGQTYSLRPRHGAAWLEAYFEGYGWVPLVGIPPRALSATDESNANVDPRVRPSDELAVVILRPFRRPSVLMLYEFVRYWIAVLSPIALAIACGVAGYPVIVKALRSRRRWRWAENQGPQGQVLLAYAALRDRCHDLNLGAVRHTPLEFQRAFLPDDEHRELAWLVTRAFWGDMARDLKEEEAATARRLASSVTKRILMEQRLSSRLLGRISRASLRDPYSLEVPNLWPKPGRIRPKILKVGRAANWRRRVTASTTLLLLASTLSCSSRPEEDPVAALPARTAPALPETLLGYEFRREPTAEILYKDPDGDDLLRTGRVWTVREGDVVQASLQIGVFRSDTPTHRPSFRTELEQAIGGSSFSTYRIGTVQLRRRQTREQITYLWLPPDRKVMQVLVMRAAFDRGEDLVRALIAYQRGIDPDAFVAAGGIAPPEIPTVSGPAPDEPEIASEPE